jgi:hypothetical protein
VCRTGAGEAPEAVVYMTTRNQLQKVSNTRSSESPVEPKQQAARAEEERIEGPTEDRNSTKPHDVITEHWRRVVTHQKVDPKVKLLLCYLGGDIDRLKEECVKPLAKIADQYETDDREVWLLLSFSFRYSPTVSRLAQGGDTSADWFRRVQHTNQCVLAMTRYVPVELTQQRAEGHNAQLNPSYEQSFKIDDAVWVYVARMRPGWIKKL